LASDGGAVNFGFSHCSHVPRLSPTTLGWRLWLCAAPELSDLFNLTESQTRRSVTAQPKGSNSVSGRRAVIKRFFSASDDDSAAACTLEPAGGSVEGRLGSGDGLGITSLECFSPPSTSPSRTALATAFWLCSKNAAAYQSSADLPRCPF
jgi:hypothetical protein